MDARAKKGRVVSGFSGVVLGDGSVCCVACPARLALITTYVQADRRRECGTTWHPPNHSLILRQTDELSE